MCISKILNIALCVAIATSGTSVTAVTSLYADDRNSELFSDVRTGIVFADSQGDSTAGESSRPRRLTSTAQVQQLLKDAGFESVRTNGRTVLTSRTLEPWTFPVTVAVADDEKTVNLVLGLASVKDSKSVSAEKLLALLESSRKHAPAQFVYNSERRRIELFGQIKNENLHPEAIRDEISRLVILAKDSQTLWGSELSQADGSADTAAESDVAVQSVPAPSSTTNDRSVEQTDVPKANAGGAGKGPSPEISGALRAQVSNVPVTLTSANQLLGRWSGSRSSAEAYAILFDAQSKFVLISIQNGKQTRSSGTFELTQSVLTLTGSDGFQLKGTVSLKSSSEMDFLPLNSGKATAALNFQKAR